MAEVETEQAKPEWWATALGLLVLLATLLVGVVVLYRIYPDALDTKADPGFLDNIFGAPLVVFAARIMLFSAALVLAFACAFTILSILHWAKHGQWLTKAGPFEVSKDAIDALRGQVEFWQQQAVSENQEAQELRERLQETEELLDMILEPDGEGTLDLEENGDNGLGDDDDHPQES